MKRFLIFVSLCPLIGVLLGVIAAIGFPPSVFFLTIALLTVYLNGVLMSAIVAASLVLAAIDYFFRHKPLGLRILVVGAPAFIVAAGLYFLERSMDNIVFAGLGGLAVAALCSWLSDQRRPADASARSSRQSSFVATSPRG
jgi:hypothetical protein